MSLVLITSCLVCFKWFRNKVIYGEKANTVAALESTWGVQILNGAVSSWTSSIMVCLGCRGWFGWVTVGYSWVADGIMAIWGAVWRGFGAPWRLGRGAVNPCISQLWAKPWGLTKVGGWALLSMASHHQVLQVSFSSLSEVNLTY